MALKPVVTATELQALSGAIQSEYTAQDDGTHILDVIKEGGFELSNVDPLRNALGHKKDELDAARLARTDAETKLAAAQEELTTLRSEKGGEKLEDLVAAQVKDIEEKLKGDLAEAQKQLDLKDNLVKKHVLEATAAAAIASAGGNIDVLMPHVLKRLRVEEEDGALKVVPLQADGTGLFMSRESGATVAGSVEELVSGPDFKTSTSFAMCFKPDNPDGGTGTPPGSGQGGGGAPSSDKPLDTNLSPAQRLSQLRKDGAGTGRRAGVGQ